MTKNVVQSSLRILSVLRIVIGVMMDGVCLLLYVWSRTNLTFFPLFSRLLCIGYPPQRLACSNHGLSIGRMHGERRTARAFPARSLRRNNPPLLEMDQGRHRDEKTPWRVLIQDTAFKVSHFPVLSIR